MTQKRIFMTGASGYIGSVITEFAIAKGYTVRGLSRSETSDAKLAALGATAVRGSLETLDVLQAEAAQADFVLHLAHTLSRMGFNTPYDKVLAIDRPAVTAMVMGLKASDSTDKSLIITSGTLTVLPDPDGKETDETAPIKTDTPLPRHKCFEHAQAVTAGTDVKAMCIRLAPFVYGRGGSGVKMFLEGAAAAGNAFYIDDGATRTTTVHVDDAARLYLLVAEKGRAGEEYNGSAETNVTMKELREAMGNVLGIPVVSLKKEEALKKNLPAFLVMFLTNENRASGEKAKRELGWKVEMPGILEDVRNGSYVAVAEELTKK